MTAFAASSERLFESVQKEATGVVPGQIIEIGREFLEGSDGWREDSVCGFFFGPDGDCI